jgi:sterol desaturase/sphingolipid hydroxylase (fatty acid hydroxylase superfamily)
MTRHAHTRRPTRRRAGDVLLVLFIMALTAGTLWLMFVPATGGADRVALALPVKQVYWAMRTALIDLFTTPALAAGFAALLVMEAVLPAVQEDRVLGRGLAHDFAWMLLHAAFVGTFIAAFLGAAHAVLEPWTTPFQQRVLAHVPGWAQVVIGYLLIELLGWFHHLLRHKVKLLWVFHEVHHSQREMNPFTLFRVHPVDYLMSEVIAVLPALLFEQYLGVALSYLAISRLHDALNHANLKTNLGWLRFIFVTPQSHRVHHSVDPAYHDMNVGVTLCVWDRLFGTHAPSDFVYPPTGIPDQGFPLEGSRPIHRMPVTLLQQLGYPFAKALQIGFGRRAP